jgi:NADH-quinone oxidoreductase subunit L
MEGYTQYALLVLFLPLLSFALQLFFGKYLPRKGDIIHTSIVGLTLVLSLSMFVMVFFIQEDPNFPYTPAFEWLTIGTFSIHLGFFLDNVTIVMLLAVAIISTLVHLYSIGYMAGDPRYGRYFGFLGLFTFSMNGIVLSNNFFMTYIFWELVGLSSYLLIGFWFEKKSASDAGKKAFIVNRIGDVGMWIGLMILFATLGTWGYVEVFEGIAAGHLQGGLLTAAGILIFMGAVGKSAQFPLHVWLPDAMEGPTPVSALIHAATMVAAGVYLSVRIFPIFSIDAMTVIAIFGGVTAILAALIAITQNDIKKVLAYSTVSQLGYMVLAVGVGAYVAAFFHLITHAMFKAGLFLGSGSVIHAMHHSYHKLHDHERDPQDMRNMGALREKMPLTFWTFIISTLALAGVPLTSGFLSKDAILAGTLNYYHTHHSGLGLLLAIIGFSAAFITAFYMFRLVYMTFFGKPADEKVHSHIHESPKVMTIPLISLAALSLFFMFTLPALNPFSDHGWFTYLIQMPEKVVPGLEHFHHEVTEGIHHAHGTAMMISVSVALLGILFATLIYFWKKADPDKIAAAIPTLYKLSLNKFYLDEIYQNGIINPFLKLCRAVGFIDMELYDKYVIDGSAYLTKKASDFAGIELDYNLLDQTLIDGVGRLSKMTGSGLKKVQTGKLQHYLMFALMAVIVLFIIDTIIKAI